MKLEKDGKTYILQERMEEIIQQRISKHVQAKNEALEENKTLQSQFESVQKQIEESEKMKTHITDLEGRLATTQSQYNRYTSISRTGITNPELIKILEWTYDENMKGLKKTEQTPIGDWLQKHVENPSNAPLAIRPHLPKSHSNPSTPSNQPSQTHPPSIPTQTHPPQTHPPSNAPQPKPPINKSISQGVQPNPEIQDTWNRMNDLNYYEQNRENIKDLFYKQFKRGR
jgi:hypothetical protein